MGFDVAFCGLEDEGAADSDGEASLMNAFEFAFADLGFDQVAGLKTVDGFLSGAGKLLETRICSGGCVDNFRGRWL